MIKRNLYWFFIFILIGGLLVAVECLGRPEEYGSVSIKIIADLLEDEKIRVNPDNSPIFTPDGKYVIVSSGSKKPFVITAEGKMTNKTPRALQKEYPPSEVSKEGIFAYTRDGTLWVSIVGKTTEHKKISDEVSPTDFVLYELLSPAKDKLLIEFQDKARKRRHCVYDLKTERLYDLPKIKQPKSGPEHCRYVPFDTYTWSPDGQWLLYCEIGNSHDVPISADLFITSWDGKKTIRLTNDNEKAIELTTAWSRNKIAFTYSVLIPKKPGDKGYDPTFGPDDWRNATRVDGIRIAEIIFEEKK